MNGGALAAPLRPTRVRAAAAFAGGVGLACVVALGASALAVVLAAGAGVLAWLAVLDIEHRLVPNRIVLPATLVILVLASAIEPSDAPARILASLGGASVLLVAALTRPGSLGMGDVKLAALIGAICGSAVLVALFVAFAATALAGLVLVVRHGKTGLQRHLPLVPFLALGGVVALLSAGA